jgi:pimeloyl-ACP methyl ester carboxylesterase
VEGRWFVAREARAAAEIRRYVQRVVAPRIQFCVGSGDRRIAYAVDGSGPPLVCSAWWVSHLESDWGDPSFRAFFSALAEHSTVIRYDRSGVGLSDRDRSTFALEDEVADLEAVIAHAAVKRPALLGISCGGPACVRYAASHRGGPSHVILYGSFVRGCDTAPPAVRMAVSALVRASWELGARTLADLFAPDLSREEARRVCRTQRVAASAETATALLELTYRMDVSDVVGTVAAPTLVVHRQGDQTVPFRCGRDLAAAIPGATLLPLEGNAHVPWRGDAAPVLDAIESFLRGAARREATANGELRRIGELWSIRFAGRRVLLKDAKGLGDLAVLLANPRREVPASVLLQRAGGSPSERVESVPALDSRAVREYRRRLAALGKEIEEAEGWNDLGRLARLRSERDAIEQQLRSSVGLGGRPRPLDDPTDRARKAVTARLRSAMARISAAHPELGQHLDASVSTGVRCVYTPDPLVTWST